MDRYSDLGPRETSLAAKKAGVRPPRLLPVPAPLRQAGPWALQSLPPHTRAHADRTHTHSSPATFRLDLVKADAPHSSPRGPQGLVLGIPVLSRLPAPACAWHHGAAVQPADGRGRGAPLALLSSQEKGSRSPKRLPLAVAVAGPDRSPQGPPCHPLPSESPPPLPPPCRREDGCSGRSAARPRAQAGGAPTPASECSRRGRGAQVTGAACRPNARPGRQLLTSPFRAGGRWGTPSSRRDRAHICCLPPAPVLPVAGRRGRLDP